MERRRLNPTVSVVGTLPIRPDGERPWELLTPREKAARVTLRHDMPMRNFDIRIEFADGSSEIVPVQARSALAAIELAGRTPLREWSRERLESIQSVTWT